MQHFLAIPRHYVGVACWLVCFAGCQLPTQRSSNGASPQVSQQRVANYVASKLAPNTQAVEGRQLAHPEPAVRQVQGLTNIEPRAMSVPARRATFTVGETVSELDSKAATGDVAADSVVVTAVDAEPQDLNAVNAPIPPHSGAQRLPVDLATALRLAGANNLQIQMASERVREAQAKNLAAKAQWLPTLNGGVGFNKHVGRIQDTRGDVFDVNRTSLYTGGGAAIANAPLTGASGGPARMFVDLSISDAFFGPLAARQVVHAAGARRASTFNNVLLDVALAYQVLLRSQSRRAIAEEAVGNAQELVRLTTARRNARKGLPADAHRAGAELAARQRQVFQADEEVGVASAALARLLRLEPSVVLLAQDVNAAPIELIDSAAPVEDLIGQAIATRPEMAEAQAIKCETYARVRQEKWRPYLPNVHAGVSGGGFGGGQNSSVRAFSDRTDLDLLAIWQVRNMGLGNRAMRAEVGSQHRQAHVNQAMVRDQIAAEVAAALHRVHSRRAQITAAQRRVEEAAKALPLNFKGILGDQLRAIEAQQAIQALADARMDYLDSVIGFNQAQFELLRAVGDLPRINQG